MTHTGNSPYRLNKDDLIRLALDYQQKYDINLDKITKELAWLGKSYNCLLLRQLTSGLGTRLVRWNVNAGALKSKPLKYLAYQKILRMVN